MRLTVAERAMVADMRGRVEALRALLASRPCPAEDASAVEWLNFLTAMKEISGNTSNDVSFVACVLAKEYLERALPMEPFDVAAKPQGAPGLDIDARTRDGRRVVGEVKTTTPYKREKGLGAQQLAAFGKDFDKLAKAEAELKFFFVTDRMTFDVMRRQYGPRLSGVTVVLLGPDGVWRASA